MQILFTDISGDRRWEHGGFDIIYEPNKNFTENKDHFLYKYAALAFKIVFLRSSKY